VPREVTALFWDVGGVLLTNGWDTGARDRAARQFAIEREEFETRHNEVFPDYETARITLDEYIERAVFWRPRDNFSRQDFRAFMFAQSKELPDGGRGVLDELTASGRYLLSALNNEGLELNAYRVSTFQLGRNFSLLFASCYVGLRKPDEAMYRLALGVTQRRPEECIFIDDRESNIEGAKRVGMRTIRFQTAPQLRADLAAQGVSGAPASSSTAR
jgi:putative hydrolase of the HAD superfamily